MGRAFATILARLARTATATALLTLVGRALATARLAFVASGAMRSLGSRSPAISGTTARDLDLAIRDLIGHGGH